MAGEEGLTMFATLAFFGLVSITFYIFVLRPILEPAAEGPGGGVANNGRNNQAHRPQRRQAPADPAPAAEPASVGGNIESILSECVTYPSHAAPSSQSSTRLGGANLLVDGLLAFRYTRAATHEQSKLSSSVDGDVVAQNRKDRAKVLSRMLSLEDRGGSAGAVTPSLPQRGSTIVISIPSSDVDCSKLRRALFLIGTHYNLLVILVVDSATELSEISEFTKKLRGSGDVILEEEVLPDHRIVAASSATGRIAFVRQLSRPEIVLDFEIDVKKQLSRFGYRVLNYKKDSSVPKGTSQLGNQLLS